MQEFIGLRPQPHLSENYFPPTDYLPESYNYIFEEVLRLKGKNYAATNDGFSGIITFTELALIARAAFSRDRHVRERARSRLTRRAGRGLGTLTPVMV